MCLFCWKGGENVEVKINKEVRDYTESIFLGLSLRQFVFSLLACVIAVGIYFTTIESLGSEITSWLCVLGTLPFALLGFITYQSMNAEEIIITAWRSFLLSKTDLISKPFNLYYEMYKGIIDKDKKEALKRDDKKLSENKTVK